MNAELSRAIFDERALAPTYPVSHAERPRVNGRIGLKQDLLGGQLAAAGGRCREREELSPIRIRCHRMGIRVSAAGKKR